MWDLIPVLSGQDRNQVPQHSSPPRSRFGLRELRVAPVRLGRHTAGMSDHVNGAVRNPHSPWPILRGVLLIGLGVLIGASVRWLDYVQQLKESDRYYPVWLSIIRAGKLAQVLHLKSPDRGHPTLLSDLHGWSEDDLKDGWGQPFHCAAVADPAGNDPDIYVWTDWVHDDGRVTLLGARVSADGKATEFGGPPRE